MDALEALVQDWKVEYLKGLMGNFHKKLAEVRIERSTSRWFG